MSGTGPRRIGSDEELQLLHRAQAGYIYNHAYRALHKADCDDVENLLLYYVDMDGACFKASGNQGVRFEAAAAALRAPPSGGEFSCSYAYRLTQHDAGFRHWQLERELVRFDDVPIGRAGGTLL